MTYNGPGSTGKNMTDEALIASLMQMYAKHDIGFVPYNSTYSTDWYACICCRNETHISDFAIGNEHIAIFCHAPECNALLLYRMLEEEDADEKVILQLFEHMIDAEEVGFSSHKNDGMAHLHGGMDWYRCPSCGNENPVKGHAFGSMHIGMGEHADNCRLLTTWYALVEREGSTPGP